MLLYLSIIILFAISLCSGFTTDELVGQSCVFFGNTSCVNIENFDMKSCRLAEGVLYQDTCQDHGFDMGRCCVLGNCFEAHLLACLYLEGTYNADGDCPCPDVPSSCCLGTVCREDYDEEQCGDEDGVFVPNRPCESSVCRTMTDYGACCKSKTCYSTPEAFCGGTWYNGSTCEEIGCHPPMNRTENYTLSGRCCGTECWEETVCGDSYSYYEEGGRCTNYPCTPAGICIMENFCQEYLSEVSCFIIGATYVEGGACKVEGSCRVGQGCQDRSKDQCTSIGGIFDNTTLCQPIQGACCNYDSKCSEVYNAYCDIGHSTFFPNQTCEETQCSQGTCCVSDFCRKVPTETLCDQIPFSYWKDSDCDVETGACSQLIEYSNTERQIEQKIDVRNITLVTRTAKALFTNATFEKSRMILNMNSTISFDNLIMTNSFINIDRSSNIQIGGCLDLKDSEITIDLTNETVEESIHLLDYTCIINEPTVSIISDDKCIGHSVGTNFISIFQLSSCIEEETSTGNPVTLALILISASLL